MSCEKYRLTIDIKLEYYKLARVFYDSVSSQLQKRTLKIINNHKLYNKLLYNKKNYIEYNILNNKKGLSF